jgi:hypothetical protein
MKALQLHYTSCRRGQSGNAGFQIRALTPGIRPGEQREIERRGVYRPPHDASPEPTAEEIARDFPRAFRSWRLESGRLALTRSGYTGRDYSGRWGNFFAHTLVLENGAVPSLWPIDLYEWNDWKDALEPEQDTDQAPSPLPVVDLGSVATAESFRFAELRDFLCEQPGRTELLARMGRAVLLGLETSRSLVVRDSATNVLYWIACLQKLFPPPHAWALSSSSYQDGPRGCADLNGTTGETGFAFDESERRYRFYMFEPTAGQHSEVPEARDDYPAVASRWLAEDPGRLARFFDFMRRFNVQRPAPDLVSAVHLFELSEAPGTPDGERLTGMISFAARYATAQGRAEILELLGSVGEALARPEDAEKLIRFLADGARETGRPNHRELAFRTWLSLVRRHVLNRGQGLEAAKATWSCLPGPDSRTAALVLQDPLWREQEPAVRNLPPEVLVFLFHVAWTYLETAGRTPAWNQPEIEAMVKSAASDPLGQALLAAVPRQPEALAAVSCRLAAAWTPDRAGRALGRVLAASDPAEAQAVRRHLDQEGSFEILIGEWLEIRDRARHPASAFEAYRRSVLASLPGLERKCGPRIRSALLEALPEPQRVPLAVSWLREQAAGQRFPDELATECLKLANLAVPLDPGARDGDGLARLVAESAAVLRTMLRPDRPFLRRVLVASRDPQTSLANLRLDGVRDAVPNLRPEEYKTFLAVFLSSALGRAGTRSEHQSVLLATFAAARAPVFERFYLDFFQARRKTSWPEEFQAALRFWLGFDPGREELRRLTTIEETARKGLVLALSRLNPERLDEMRQNLKKTRLDQRSSTRWGEIEEALAARSRGPWARFMGRFVRD